jgi:hypothetical protein
MMLNPLEHRARRRVWIHRILSSQDTPDLLQARHDYLKTHLPEWEARGQAGFDQQRRAAGQPDEFRPDDEFMGRFEQWDEQLIEYEALEQILGFFGLLDSAPESGATIGAAPLSYTTSQDKGE